jgi:hypothetical protein
VFCLVRLVIPTSPGPTAIHFARLAGLPNPAPHRFPVHRGATARSHPGIDVEIVRRDPSTRGFVIQHRRWVVERSFGWLMNHRRLARDYEALPVRSEAMIHVAMIGLMTRRLTGENTPTWRGT